MQLALILGPGLAFALLIGYLTRNDPITAKAFKEVQQQPVYRLDAIASCVFAPIVVLFLLNNLFGDFLLILSGVMFIFQDKLFPSITWIKGIAAKIAGVSHFLIGVSLAFHHVS